MRSWLVLPALVLLAACFPTTPPQEVTPEDVTLDAPPERVWQALTLVYTDIGMPIENMDRSSWFMRSDEMIQRPSERNSEMFDCGRTDGAVVPDHAENATIRASITTILIPEADRTIVRNRVNANGVMHRATLMGASDVVVECHSRGVLEQRVVDALRERL